MNNFFVTAVMDNSGLRLFYTDHLRQNEGAMLVTGIIISPLQVIPPGQKAYKTAGYCDFHCTDSVSCNIKTKFKWHVF